MSIRLRTEESAVKDKHVLQYPRAVDVIADLKAISGGDPTNYPALTGWVMTQAFQLVTSTRNADEALVTGTIVWPDGATGVFTATELSTAFPGAVDAYTVTYVSGDLNYTVTQPAVTRNASGSVTSQPAITITKTV